LCIRETEEKLMRLVIDLQGAQGESRFRGIGRYSLAMTEAIVRLNQEHTIFIVLNGLLSDSIEPLRARFSSFLPNDHVLVWKAPGPTRATDPQNRVNRQVAQRLREGFIRSLAPDVILITSPFEGYGDEAIMSIGDFDQQTPTVSILYDLIPLISPDPHLSGNHLFQGHYAQRLAALKKADRLLAISESAKQEAIRHLHLPPEKIVTVLGAYDAIFQQLDQSEEQKKAFCKSLNIGKPFVFYTGGADPHKNLPRLIQAFAQIPAHIRNRFQLVFAGNMPATYQAEFNTIARNHGLSTADFVLLGYVPDAQLVKLFNAAALFVYPSLHEGLGIPPLEAMACGTPVIGSNASSLPEVIGLDAAMFNPDDIAQMSLLITKALTDESYRNALIENGAQRLGQFSWESSARLAMRAIEELHQERGSQNTESHEQPTSQHINSALIESIATIPDLPVTPYDKFQLAHCLSYNHAPSSRKKLFIDVSELIERDASTGIQRVVKAVLNEALREAPDQFEVIPVYANSVELGYRVANALLDPDQENSGIQAHDRLIDFNAGDVFLGLDLIVHIAQFQKPFFQQLRQKGVTVKFVVYDVLPVTHASFFPSGSTRPFQEWLAVVQENDEALCISQATAAELKTYFDAHPLSAAKSAKISSFSLGADFPAVPNHTPHLQTDQQLSIFPEPIFTLPTFLMVGTVEPRKGHRQVLEAFDRWWQGGAQVILLIAGKQGWDMADTAHAIQQHPQYQRLLFWFDQIDDPSLQQAYERSSALIMASEGEGFGLPLIEAAHYALPIIARDLPVFREIAGGFASYFPVNASAPVLQRHLQDWLALYLRDDHPQSTGLPYLSWAQSTAQLLAMACAHPHPIDQQSQNG
jgi:glycosyltransferase involved in cell wall biosynthesis